jgi:hypothetical protein
MIKAMQKVADEKGMDELLGPEARMSRKHKMQKGRTTVYKMKAKNQGIKVD